ncbi:tyrosine-type recombinase/integrase [Avibacterium endocarditidis]|nr:tyrosine-type recombinase/integrase [Avibacterium endocarditidis]
MATTTNVKEVGYMGRPRKPSNQYLPENLRPKTVKRKSGKTVTYWLYRTAGKTEISLGKDRNQAFIKAAQMNIEREQKGGSITFGLVAKRYKDEIIARKKASTAKNNLIWLKSLLAFFASAPLDQIESPHIVEYMNRRKQTPAMANNEFSLFNHIWRYARQWGYTKLPSPSESVDKFPINRRSNYIEDDIFQLVHKYANQDIKDLMDLAYLIGQRPSDLVNIQKEHIFDGYLHIAQQKTQAKLRIKLVGRLAEILNRRLSSQNNFLFRSKNGTKLTADKLAKIFARLRNKVVTLHPEYESELRAFQFRDLRAKSGTDKAMQLGEEEARKQLGHTTVAMTKTYIRKAPIVTPILNSITDNKKA